MNKTKIRNIKAEYNNILNETSKLLRIDATGDYDTILKRLERKITIYSIITFILSACAIIDFALMTGVKYTPAYVTVIEFISFVILLITLLFISIKAEKLSDILLKLTWAHYRFKLVKELKEGEDNE